MPKAAIVYLTRTQQTKEIASLIAEGIRLSGGEADVMTIAEVEKAGMQTLEGYDAVVLGSPTYHGEMLQAMKMFLFALEKINLKDKVGGAFGAFGWSGEAPGRIFDTMKNIYNMNMVGGPLQLKSASLGGGLKMAQDYGKDVAKRMGVAI